MNHSGARELNRTCVLKQSVLKWYGITGRMLFKRARDFQLLSIPRLWKAEREDGKETFGINDDHKCVCWSLHSDVIGWSHCFYLFISKWFLVKIKHRNIFF